MKNKGLVTVQSVNVENQIQRGSVNELNEMEECKRGQNIPRIHVDRRIVCFMVVYTKGSLKMGLCSNLLLICQRPSYVVRM